MPPGDPALESSKSHYCRAFGAFFAGSPAIHARPAEDDEALPPSEQALDVGELERDVRRATVVALAGIRRRFHLT